MLAQELFRSSDVVVDVVPSSEVPSIPGKDGAEISTELAQA